MQAVEGKNIIIFRGEGGREFLADTLKERGAQVQYAEVYRRAKPQTDSSALLQALQHGKVDIISITSNEALRNLFDMVGPEGHNYLCRIPLVAVSERAVTLAKELGCVNPPYVSGEVSDEAMVETLVQVAQRGVAR